MADKYKRMTWLIIGLWAVISLCVWLKPTDAYSKSERRELEEFPEISFQSLISGKFMLEFEDYAMDQFPMRDRFRTLKAGFSTKALGQQDDHGIYIVDNYAVKMEYPLNESGIQRAVERFNYIYETYMKDCAVKGYYALIPDKNYFLADTHGYLSMDYERLFEIVDDGMNRLQKIDIKELLTIDDYYQTDIHWKQEKIIDVAQCLLECMNKDFKPKEKISEDDFQQLDMPFLGVYAGQTAYDLTAECIYYYESERLTDCLVYDYEHDKTMAVYDMDKAYGKDPYEMFLSGALSLITIENPMADTQRELILFRDSFGSSIAPLLMEGYSKITLVDIRYIHPDTLGKYLTFTNQDVLFLYSTSVVNNGETIK